MKKLPAPVTFHIPNPKTGRDVEVVCDFSGMSDSVEWWRLRAYDAQEHRTTAPYGMIAAGEAVFDPLTQSEFGNMHEPQAFVPYGGGAGLVLYMAAALLAASRRRDGIRASDTLSRHSMRLWDKMVEHGLAKRGGNAGPAGALYANDVERWIADYRKDRG